MASSRTTPVSIEPRVPDAPSSSSTQQLQGAAVSEDAPEAGATGEEEALLFHAADGSWGKGHAGTKLPLSTSSSSSTLSCFHWASTCCTLLLGLALGIALSPLLLYLHSASPFLLSTPSSPSLLRAHHLPPTQLPYSSMPTIPPWTPSSTATRQLTFLVVGDWGRDGMYNQSSVAQSLGVAAEESNSSFVVSTGDNFYDTGLQDEADPQFSSSFSRVYAHPALLRLNWYSVLGNHDYVRNPAAQTGRGLRMRDPRWHCTRTFQLKLHPPCHPPPFSSSPQDQQQQGKDTGAASGSSLVCRPLLELFFIDTSPLLLSEWGPGGVSPGARLNFSGLPTPDHSTFTKSLVMALEEALAASDAIWKAVVGHHPVRSVGTHGDTRELVEAVLPVLEAHGVDAFINGHDHSLQFIKRQDSPLLFVTSGAGSKAYRKQREHTPEEGVLLDYNGQGFVVVRVEESKMELTYKDVLGNQLFNFVQEKKNQV